MVCPQNGTGVLRGLNVDVVDDEVKVVVLSSLLSTGFCFCSWLMFLSVSLTGEGAEPADGGHDEDHKRAR